MSIIRHFGALMIALLAFWFVPLPNTHNPHTHNPNAYNNGLYTAPAKLPPLRGGYYVPEPLPHNAHLDLIASSLHDDRAITLFGSSELGDNKQSMPYQYFAETMGVPVVAFGQAHFDTMGAYMVLQAVHKSIKPRAKIVFIVSPGWFADGHFLPYAFDKYVGGDVARTVAQNGTPQGKRLMQAYVGRFGRDLNFDMAYGCWFGICGGATGVRKLSGMFAMVNTRARQWRAVLLGEQGTTPDYPKPLYPLGKKSHNWTTTLSTLQQAELALQTNNQYGIRNDYYNAHVRHARVGLPKPAYAKMGDYGWQLQSLSALLTLLQNKQANAIFVMQPINQLGYNDVDTFAPINATVRDMIQGAGFTYLDMYTPPQTTPKNQGILRDLFHFSPYGFARMNRDIQGVYYGR